MLVCLILCIPLGMIFPKLIPPALFVSILVIEGIIIITDKLLNAQWHILNGITLYVLFILAIIIFWSIPKFPITLLLCILGCIALGAIITLLVVLPKKNSNSFEDVTVELFVTLDAMLLLMADRRKILEDYESKLLNAGLSEENTIEVYLVKLQIHLNKLLVNRIKQDKDLLQKFIAEANTPVLKSKVKKHVRDIVIRYKDMKNNMETSNAELEKLTIN
jgi:hypothetical protein